MTVTREGTNIYNGPASGAAVLAPTINLGLGDGVPVSMATSTWSVDSIFGGSLTTASYCGFRMTPGTLNLSTRQYICWQMANTMGSRANFATFANRGIVVVFSDGTNWSAFTIFGSDYSPYASGGEGAFAGYQGFAANDQSTSATWILERTVTPVASSGTLNWAAVTAIEIHVKSIASHAITLAFGRLALCDRPIVTGTETSNVWTSLRNNYGSSGNGYVYPWAVRPGAQYTLSALNKPQTLQFGVQIGNGSTTTTVTDSKRGISFWGRPADYDSNGGFSIPPNPSILTTTPRLIDVFQAAADSLTFTDVSMTTTSGQGWRVRGNTAANCSLTRCDWYKHAQMELAHGKYYDCVWDSGTTPVIITANTILTGGEIRAGAGMQIAGASGNYAAITCTFAGNSPYDIQAGTGGAGTYTITGISAASGYTLKLRNDSATNAVVFVLPVLPGVTISTSTAGGSISYTLPTADLTVTSTESSTLIQVFTTGTQTVLASTTGTSLVYTHSSNTVDIVVQKAGFLPQRAVGVALSGTMTRAFTLLPDYNYTAAHGLTYTTSASWSRASNQLTVPTWGPTVRQVYSLMIDAFIAETSLRNTAFNLSMNGPTALFLIEGAEGASDASITNMTGGGVRYLSVAEVVTAEFAAFQSSGVVSGSQVEYELGAGATVVDTRATGDVNQMLKTYGDASHGNFDKRNHLQFKVQRNGYRQAEYDVIAAYSLSQLEPTFYVVSLVMLAIPGLVLGNPGITGVTVTKHGSPVSWNAGDGAKNYSITIEDSGTNTAEDILRWLNYNLSLDAVFQGIEPFYWPEMVTTTGSTYETLRGVYHGNPDVVAGVRVIRAGGTPHPGFARFQADDGTYGTPVVQYTLTVAGSVTLVGAEVRIYDLDNTPAGSLGTELTGTESNGGATLTYSYYTAGVGNSIWIQILKSGYVEFGQEYVTTAANATITANLREDTNA